MWKDVPVSAAFNQFSESAFSDTMNRSMTLKLSDIRKLGGLQHVDRSRGNPEVSRSPSRGSSHTYLQSGVKTSPKSRNNFDSQLNAHWSKVQIPDSFIDMTLTLICRMI